MATTMIMNQYRSPGKSSVELDGQNYFLDGKYFRWEIFDGDGWQLTQDKIREININRVIGDVEKTEDITIMLMVRKPHTDMDDMSDMWVNFYYEKDYIKFNDLKFKMSFKESDEFIMKVLRDNGWTIPPRHKLAQELS